MLMHLWSIGEQTEQGQADILRGDEMEMEAEAEMNFQLPCQSIPNNRPMQLET